ncbi:hypothetical protein M0R45_031522 [Rubus argutus]|uniref:Uncharacterized protein n=1 Tax=Rubus argutus TaxID=59490 RepID=A0AAW1WG33_RUBAR
MNQKRKKIREKREMAIPKAYDQRRAIAVATATAAKAEAAVATASAAVEIVRLTRPNNFVKEHYSATQTAFRGYFAYKVRGHNVRKQAKLTFVQRYHVGLAVFGVGMESGNWLQAPYVYYLYSTYGLSKGDTGQLFIAGFGSSMLFGTVDILYSMCIPEIIQFV